MVLKTILREVRGNAGYDAMKELLKVLFPVSAGAFASFLGAHAALIWGCVLIAALVVTITDVSQRRKARIGPLEIEAARWVCVQDPQAFKDVKDILRGMISGDSLYVLLNNEILGDPCLMHQEQGGHGKRLEISYARKGFIVVPPNEYLSI